MNILSDVSETAIITLRARTIESQKHNPVIRDDMSSITLSRHIALRARKYDFYAKEFLAKHPGELVVGLGCGFDTRYWRVSNPHTVLLISQVVL